MRDEQELEKLRAAKCYYTWSGMFEVPENDLSMIEAYFTGCWTAFSTFQQIEFLSMCNRGDFCVLVDYDIWK